MNKKSPPINYKDVIPHPLFNSEFGDVNKYSLCVAMRLIDRVPNPSCIWNRKDLIEKLERNGVKKSIDLGKINSASSFRDYLSKHNNVFICK